MVGSGCESEALLVYLCGEKKRLVGEAVPYGRMGTPEDITGAAVFLASDLAMAQCVPKPRLLGLPERLAEALARLLSPLL